MRKYRIYSGTKPTSASKTYAVSWGSKYFTVSPTTGKEAITAPTMSLTNSGNILTLKITNNQKDSIMAYPLEWYFSNNNVNNDATITYSFGKSSLCFGSYTSMTYSWDISSYVKPGINSMSAAVNYAPIASYQDGGGNARTVGLTIYKKFTAPTVTKNGLSFTNTSYSYSNKFYSVTQYRLDPYSYSFKLTNPNSITASYYSGSNTSRSGTLASGGSVVVDSASQSYSDVNLGVVTSSKTVLSKTYYLDSGSSTTKNSNTVSSGATGSIVIPAPPQMVSCLPTSETANTFQVTVKNNNSRQYYCRVQYNQYDASSSDYWVANCPANGQATMVSTGGSTQTFTFTRGKAYILSLYFFTTSGSIAYSGTQQSQTVHYYYQTPDSGYLYVTPTITDHVYDDISDPTQVTFTVRNDNPITLYARIDLYKGSSTSGTRVDYWKVTVKGYSSATCPNTWSISAGTTYTVRCYFMVTDSYSGTQKSGSYTSTFTTPTGS